MISHADGGEGERDGGEAQRDGFAEFEEVGGGGGEGTESYVWVEGWIGGGFGVRVGGWGGMTGHETLKEGELLFGGDEPDGETWISRNEDGRLGSVIVVSVDLCMRNQKGPTHVGLVVGIGRECAFQCAKSSQESMGDGVSTMVRGRSLGCCDPTDS